MTPVAIAARGGRSAAHVRGALWALLVARADRGVRVGAMSRRRPASARRAEGAAAGLRGPCLPDARSSRWRSCAGCVEGVGRVVIGAQRAASACGSRRGLSAARSVSGPGWLEAPDRSSARAGWAIRSGRAGAPGSFETQTSTRWGSGSFGVPHRDDRVTARSEKSTVNRAEPTTCADRLRKDDGREPTPRGASPARALRRQTDHAGRPGQRPGRTQMTPAPEASERAQRSRAGGGAPARAAPRPEDRPR